MKLFTCPNSKTEKGRGYSELWGRKQGFWQKFSWEFQIKRQQPHTPSWGSWAAAQHVQIRNDTWSHPNNCWETLRIMSTIIITQGILNIYCVPGTVLRPLHSLSHLILTVMVWWRYHYCVDDMDKETESYNHSETFPSPPVTLWRQDWNSS